MTQNNSSILEIHNLVTELAGKEIFKDLNLSVNKGEIVAIIGQSGEGKTSLLRSILMLLKPRSGAIKVFGVDITQCSEAQIRRVRQQWGVMFQTGALFSSLTVLENVMLPIKENHFAMSVDFMQEIALFKISLVGLGVDAAMKYPAELSGGMRKRAALARALALDPELIFLDEPTNGLDPKSSDDFDALMLNLNKNLDITLVIITHDLDTLWRVPERVLFLGEKKILASCSMSELVKIDNPLIQEYFSGPRGSLIRNVLREDNGK